ncbi:tape measure protein [Acinetobacter pullicarnis]|uniref:tape measure protein n=1 Tax=Acinetobacter pullicarnis TaxID=2576829 RepID=UPI001E291967|nr:tape measure protein [Acinetobacter pullicarnis]
MARSNTEAEKSANGLSNAYQKLAGYMTGILTVGSAISRADGWVQMAAQIQNAAGSAEKYDMIQKHLLETANTTYRPLKEAQQVYLDVGTALEATGDSTERALRITDSLSFSYTHNATAADKAASATNAFKSTIYSQKVSNQNWLSILSAVPSIVDDLNRSTGIAKDKILQMGNAGELSSRQLNDALDSNREHSEKLANGMSNSLTDGLTVLGNAVDTYLGNLNKSAGATDSLAGQLGKLAENIDLVAKAATLVGIGFMTKTIIAHTVATHDAIVSSNQRRASLIAETQANAVASATEVRRTAAIVSLRVMQLADAQATAARMSGMARLAYVQTTILPLETKLTQATSAHAAAIAIDTVNQNANNAARSRGALLLGALGGWTGVATIGVMALSAAYLLFNDSAKSATSTLNAQITPVDELVKKYSELDALQRKTYMRELEIELKSLTNAYTASYAELSGYVEWLENSGSVSESTARKMSELLGQYTRGQIDATTFSTEVGNLIGVQQKHKDKIDDLTTAQSKSKVEYERVKAAQAALTNQTQSAIDANNGETKSIDAKREAQQKLNAEQQKAYDKVKTSLEKENYINVNKGNGWSYEKALYMANFREDSGMGFGPDAKTLSKEQKAMAEAGWLLQLREEARAKAAQATTKELKEQENTTKRLVGLVGSTGRSSGNHLHVQYPKGSNKGGVTADHMSRFQLGGQTLKPSMTNSHYGKVRDGKKHGGWDFAAPAGTEVTTNVAVKDVQKMVSENGGHTSRVTFADGVVIELMHQIPAMMQKVKGGASKGSSTSSSKDAFKAFQDQQKEAEQAAKNRIQLEMNVADQVTKIKTKLAEDFKEIDKAGFSDDKAKALKAKYQAQADSEIELAKFALQTKLDDYSDFQKTEMQMLEKSYAQKKVYAAQDLELGANERKEAVVLLDKQLKQEQAMLMIAQEQRMFQMRQQFLTETQAMQERYRLEEAELIKVADLKEREFQRQMIRLRQEEESRARLQNAQMNWANVDAQMKGTTGRIQVEQDRFSRLDSSQQLFDAQMGAVDGGEQGALGRLQEQRNQDLITEQEFENQKTLILQTALETRQAIYDAHALRQTEVEEAYQKDSINLQFTQAQQLTGSFANMFRGILGESSGAYRAMYAAQQSFAIAQAGMNMWSSASKAYNDSLSPTVWGRMADASKAMLDQGTFLAMIQSITPQGFSTGGYVRGPGTGTSDSIPAFLSDKEFVVKASAVEKIGVDNLNAMNRTGELPQVQRERRQAQVIGAASSGDVINAPITVQVSVQADGSSSVDTQGQAKQLGDMIGNAVRTVIRQEQRQGGLLSK